MLSLDWSMIGVLLLGEEAQKLRTEPLSTAPVPAAHAISIGSDTKWDIDPRELKFTGEIKEESGLSFSQRGTWNGRPVMMRAFRFQEMNSAMIDELVQELIEFSALDHPHVCHFLGVARVDATVYQVNEYVARGSLYTIIQHSKKDFNGLTILRLARELASAMGHLHSIAHVHGHLKSSAVLLDENMAVRLADVGVRRLIAYAEVILVERSATAWSAPEVLDGAPASRASDVYSFGVVCWELLSRRVPYDGKSFADIRTAVLRQREHLVLPAHPDLPQPFNTLVSRCLEHNPLQRPAFAEINKALAAIVL